MPSSCTAERHASWKKVRGIFVAMTDFAGWQEDVGEPPYELRLCRLCFSSLCDGTRQAEPVRAVVIGGDLLGVAS